MSSSTKNVLLPLLRREILSSSTPVGRGVGGIAASSASSTPPLQTTTGRLFGSGRRWASGRAGGLLAQKSNGIAMQRRAFSGTARRGNEASSSAEDEGASFDPAQIERESDEVDVCIVGGGKLVILLRG